jgi:hypothetical protein
MKSNDRDQITSITLTILSMLRIRQTTNESPVDQADNDDLGKIYRCGCTPLDIDSTSHTLLSDSTMRWNLEESAASLGECKSRPSSSIRFGKVKIRDYERIVSDHPAVRNGVPIG